MEKAHKWLAKRNNINFDKEQLQSQLEHVLDYNRNIGNSYTAALYVSLVSLLDNDPEDLSGKRVGLYSYGSGCVGEYFAVKIQPGYREYLDTAWNQSLLANRQELTYDQYQHFYSYSLPTDGRDCLLPKYQSGRFRLAKISEHKRFYQELQTVPQPDLSFSVKRKSQGNTEHKSLTIREFGEINFVWRTRGSLWKFRLGDCYQSLHRNNHQWTG